MDNSAYINALYSAPSFDNSKEKFAYNSLDFLANNPINKWAANLSGDLDYIRTQESERKAALINAYNSATQYQRAVDDMRAAGLNPALAYSNGGSPVSASMSHAYNNSTAGMNNLLSAIVNGAFSLARSSLIGDNLEDLTKLRIKSAEHIADQRNLNAYTVAKSRDREAMNRLKYKNEFRRDHPYDYYKTFDDPLIRNIRNGKY